MHKLFTESFRNEPQKRTDFGPVPKSWEVVPLKSLLREPLRNGHSAKATTDADGIRTLTGRSAQFADCVAFSPFRPFRSEFDSRLNTMVRRKHDDGI